MWIRGGRGGGLNAYPQNVDKKHVFFFEPFPYIGELTVLWHGV